eukprot:11177450-Lingulodinium_polyedra.AAC.1
MKVGSPLPEREQRQTGDARVAALKATRDATRGGGWSWSGAWPSTACWSTAMSTSSRTPNPRRSRAFGSARSR